MARTRYIRPDFFKDEDLAELTYVTQRLYIGLWCFCDREGRLKDSPKRIKAEIMPYDEHGIDHIDELLGYLDQSGFIQRYQVDRKSYIQIRTFVKYQKPHKNEPESTIPPNPNNSRVNRDLSGEDQDKSRLNLNLNLNLNKNLNLNSNPEDSGGSDSSLQEVGETNRKSAINKGGAMAEFARHLMTHHIGPSLIKITTELEAAQARGHSIGEIRDALFIDYLKGNTKLKGSWQGLKIWDFIETLFPSKADNSIDFERLERIREEAQKEREETLKVERDAKKKRKVESVEYPDGIEPDEDLY